MPRVLGESLGCGRFLMGKIPLYAPYGGSWGGGRLRVSEAPLYPPRPEIAQRPEMSLVEEWLQCDYLVVMPRRYVASRPPSEMPSTPAPLDSPLASAEDEGFRV